MNKPSNSEHKQMELGHHAKVLIKLSQEKPDNFNPEYVLKLLQEKYEQLYSEK